MYHMLTPTIDCEGKIYNITDDVNPSVVDIIKNNTPAFVVYECNGERKIVNVVISLQEHQIPKQASSTILTNVIGYVGSPTIGNHHDDSVGSADISESDQSSTIKKTTVILHDALYGVEVEAALSMDDQSNIIKCSKVEIDLERQVVNVETSFTSSILTIPLENKGTVSHNDLIDYAPIIEMDITCFEKRFRAIPFTLVEGEGSPVMILGRDFITTKAKLDFDPIERTLSKPKTE